MYNKELIQALKLIYKDFGVETFFTDSSYISAGLNEMVDDAEYIIDVLRYSIDAGIGEFYVPLISTGDRPDDGFNAKVHKFLIDLNLDDDVAHEVIEIFYNTIWNDSLPETTENQVIHDKPVVVQVNKTVPPAVTNEVEAPAVPAKNKRKPVIIAASIFAVIAVVICIIIFVVPKKSDITESSGSEITSSSSTVMSDTSSQTTETDNTDTSGSAEDDATTAYWGNYHGSNEWLILDKDEDTVLLLSKDVIDARQFNSVLNKWESSDIRNWLNNTYCKEAFSESEQNEMVDIDGDKVSLLTADEAEKYFKSDDERLAKPSDYCLQQGIHTSSTGYCSWWLKTKGSESNLASCVYSAGYVDKRGGSVYDASYGVRPVIRIRKTALVTDPSSAPAKNASAAEPFEVYSFGNYQGATDWYVLERKSDRMLLVSKEVIDVKPFDAYPYVENDNTEHNYYNDKGDYIIYDREEGNDWKVSMLKKWLNNDYLKTAFNDKEKNRLIKTDGAKVFLLSIDEVNKYMPNEEQRIAEVSDYASERLAKACYWLRSPGLGKTNAAYVGDTGVIFESGHEVSDPYVIGVRPAVWVKCD